MNLVTGDFVTSGDFSESAYPGNSVDFDEDFDFSGESGYYGKYGDIGESGNSSANFGSGDCGVSGNSCGSGLPGENLLISVKLVMILVNLKI